MVNKKAMKLALGKIKSARDCHPNAVDTLLFEAEEILETALAEQPAQQEPVAAECKFDREQKWVRCEIAHHNLVQSEPHKWPDYQTRLLYTSPPAQRTWVGLTDEEIDRLWSQSLADTESETWLPLREFARAIEAAHGIKENT